MMGYVMSINPEQIKRKRAQTAATSTRHLIARVISSCYLHQRFEVMQPERLPCASNYQKKKNNPAMKEMQSDRLFTLNITSK